MAQLANTFEGGTNGTILTAGSGGNTGGASGDFFNQVAKPSDGIMQFQNSVVAEGSLAVQMATRTVTGALNLIWTSTSRGSIADDYGRFYFYSDDITTGGIAKNIIRWFNAGSSLGGILMGNNRLYVTDNTNATVSGNSTTLLPAGQWVRIEYHLHPRTDGTGSVQIKMWLNPNSAGTPDWDFTISNLTYTAATTDQITIGNAGPGANWPSATGSIYFDGIVTGASTWVGPALVTQSKTGGGKSSLVAGGTKSTYTVQYQRPNADLMPNLVSNPSFENGLSWWGGSTAFTISQSTDHAMFGTHSAKSVALNTTGDNNRLNSAPMNLKTGKIIVVSVYIWVPSDYTSPWIILTDDGYFSGVAGASVDWTHNSPDLNLRDQWQRLWYGVTINGPGDTVRGYPLIIRDDLSNSGVGQALYMDGGMIEYAASISSPPSAFNDTGWVEQSVGPDSDLWSKLSEASPDDSTYITATAV